jgi:hypothetical protein
MQPMQRGTVLDFGQIILLWSSYVIIRHHVFPVFQFVRTRSTIQEAISAKDKALLEKAYELREESRMEEENAQGVVTTCSPRGHHVNLGQVDLI